MFKFGKPNELSLFPCFTPNSRHPKPHSLFTVLLNLSIGEAKQPPNNWNPLLKPWENLHEPYHCKLPSPCGVPPLMANSKLQPTEKGTKSAINEPLTSVDSELRDRDQNSCLPPYFSQNWRGAPSSSEPAAMNSGERWMRSKSTLPMGIFYHTFKILICSFIWMLVLYILTKFLVALVQFHSCSSLLSFYCWFCHICWLYF